MAGKYVGIVKQLFPERQEKKEKIQQMPYTPTDPHHWTQKHQAQWQY